MFSSTFTLFVTLALASASSLAAAVPVSNAKSVTSGGALFWMTNEPTGNFILSAKIGSDGKLTTGGKFATNGLGAHGGPNTQGPDGLFAQGSVKVVNSTLVAVNPGSNTAVMFAINPKNPAFPKMVGEPISTGGEFPMSATIDANTGNTCILNGGSVNGVSCFKADPKSGLVPIPNTIRSLSLNQTTPATGPAGSASQILFSSDGKRLFASVKGSSAQAPGFIAAWDVDPTDFSLSQDFVSSVPSNGGGLPFSMTIVNNVDGADALLNTDPAIGFNVFNFNGGLNATSTSTPIEGQSAACWSEFSAVTGNYYITDIGTSILTEVAIDPKTLKATIVKQYPQLKNSATIDQEVATINGKDFLYIMSPNATVIQSLSLKAPGDAQPLQTFSIAKLAKQLNVKVSQANLQGMSAFFP